MKSRNRNKDLLKAAQGLKKELAGRIEERVLMKRYTTFKIGGICDVMVFPKNREDLAKTIEYCESRGLPWMILGRGSNLLVLDQGLDELVINLQDGFKEVSFDENGIVRAQAGVRLAHLVKQCQDEGLSGLEFCAGIPGTVGGAIKMNAGAQGSEIGEWLKSVEFYRYPEGNYHRKRDELKFEYRQVSLKKDEIVLGGEFALKQEDPRRIRAVILEYLKKRRQTQTVSYPSAGSIFKNPPGDYAGRIIEELGLKGYRIGDAQVSDIHANFIVNRGRAKARDVLELIKLIQQKARREKGIELELEIEVVGKAND